MKGKPVFTKNMDKVYLDSLRNRRREFWTMLAIGLMIVFFSLQETDGERISGSIAVGGIIFGSLVALGSTGPLVGWLTDRRSLKMLKDLDA